MAIFSCLQSNFLFFSTFKTKSLVLKDHGGAFWRFQVVLFEYHGDPLRSRWGFLWSRRPTFYFVSLIYRSRRYFQKIKVHFLKSISHSIFSFRGSLFITPRSAPYKKLKKIKISASTSFWIFVVSFTFRWYTSIKNLNHSLYQK